VNTNCWKDAGLKDAFFGYEKTPKFHSNFTTEWTKIGCQVMANRQPNMPLKIDFGTIELDHIAPLLGVDHRLEPDLALALLEIRQDTEDSWKTNKDTIHNYPDYHAFAASTERFVRFLHRKRPGRSEFPSDAARSLRAAASSLSSKLATLVRSRSVVWRNDTDPNPAVHDLLDSKVLALDLGSLPNWDDKLLVANYVVQQLWATHEDDHATAVKKQTEPTRITFLVIDESHNLLPPVPSTPSARLLCSQVIRIAAEGRKYGLFLIVVTQRPRKIDTNILNECENLFLMRMTNQTDLTFLREQLGYLESDDLTDAPLLKPGEFYLRGSELIAEKLHAAPRRTAEGGKSPSDKTWKEKFGWRT
jgi:hypothetical protein